VLAENARSAGTFFSVSLEMLEPGRIVPCDLWLQHRGGDALLYRSRDLPLEEAHIERLRESGVTSILVAFTDADRWAEDLGQRLRGALTDGSRPLSERVETIMKSSRATMRDIFADPTAPGVKARVGHLADTFSELMHLPDALVTTVRLMEHDYYTYTHSVHVALYSLALARAAGLSDPAYLSSLGRGCLMHDIGKVGLPAALLNKTSPLTKREFDRIKTHPMRGTKVFDDAGWSDSLARDIVLSHHERLDGSGYPRGIHGEFVTVSVRIAAICDAYDAMTTDRSYAKAMPAADALRIIATKGRYAYDTVLVKTFIASLLDPLET